MDSGFDFFTNVTYLSVPYECNPIQLQILLSAQCLCPLPRGHSSYSFTFYIKLNLLSLTVLSSIIYICHIFRRHNGYISRLTLSCADIQRIENIKRARNISIRSVAT